MSSNNDGRDGSYYRMSRSHEGSGRLVLQHFLWKVHFGWSLHPALTAGWVSQASNQPYRIADVACGNGCWAVEQATAGLAPGNQVQCTGFDVSDAQFPGQHLLPDNVKLEKWNMFEAPAEKYHGYFDIVHVRLILAAIADGNPRPVLKNLLTLLKPGGAIQWSETDVGVPDGTTKDIGVVSVRDQIFEAYGAAYGKKPDYEWISGLPHIFAEHGMQGISRLASWPQKEWRKYWWDNLFNGLREIIAATKSEEVEKAFDQMEERLASHQDVLVQTNQIVIGWKARD